MSNIEIPSTPTPLVGFRETVREVFSGQTDGPVFNGTIEHASIVIEEAFLAARHDVRILTHQLDPACYGRDAIRAAARTFLSRGNTHLHILIEDLPSYESAFEGAFVRESLDLAPGRVTLGVVPPEILARYRYNFLTIDSEAYRFEADRLEPAAAVAGGPQNRATTERLNAIFNDLEGVSNAQAA